MSIIYGSLRTTANIEEFGPKTPLLKMPRTAHALLASLPAVFRTDLTLDRVIRRDEVAEIGHVSDTLLEDETVSVDALRLYRAWALRNVNRTAELPLPARMPNDRQRTYRLDIRYALEWIIDVVNYRVDGMPLPVHEDGTTQTQQDDAEQEEAEQRAAEFTAWLKTVRPSIMTDEERAEWERAERERWESAQQRVRDTLKAARQFKRVGTL